MKKTAAKVSKSKSTKRPSRKTGASNQTVLLQRIVIISACVVLVALGAVLLNKQQVTQSVAGASVMRGLFMQATVAVPTTDGVASYNIYYKTEGEKEFTNAVRNIPPTVSTYTISHLKKGASYVYRFAAVDPQGREFLFSEVKPLIDLQPM